MAEAPELDCRLLLTGRQEGLPALEVGHLAASVSKCGRGGRIAQSRLDDLRFFGRPDPPAMVEDEVSADPGTDGDGRRRRRQ